MDSNLTQSALLTTSAKTDVQRSGGKVTITGLLPFNLDKMLAASYKIHRAEVRQVITVDLGSITLAASTRYSIKAGNVLNEYEAGQQALKNYAFTSGPAIPTAVAVCDGIVAQINSTSITNYISAVRAGNTVVITDDAGYYPIRPAGRAGPSTVTLGDNVVGGTVTVTTAGVIAYGDGTYILSNIPVKDPMTGNLISGELNTPSGAVAGQFYDGFAVTYAKEVNHQAVSGLRAEKVLRQLIYVDNGLGTSVANLAGYEAFLTEFQRLIYHNFTKDSNSMVSFLENAPFYQKKGGGLPTGTAGDENLISFPSMSLSQHVLGTQTIVYTPWSTTGLTLVQDAANNDGLEVSAGIEAVTPQEFVVGQQAFSFKVRVAIADVSDTDDCAFGFRLKEDYQANLDDYNDMAVLNVISGDIFTETILNGAATTSTDTTNNWADGETHTLEVRVDTDGAVTYLIDDVAPVTTVAFTFDSGDVLIPFAYSLLAAASSSETTVSKWFSIADTLSY